MRLLASRSKLLGFQPKNSIEFGYCILIVKAVKVILDMHNSKIRQNLFKIIMSLTIE